VAIEFSKFLVDTDSQKLYTAILREGVGLKTVLGVNFASVPPTAIRGEVVVIAENLLRTRRENFSTALVLLRNVSVSKPKATPGDCFPVLITIDPVTEAGTIATPSTHSVRLPDG
jgi:hypothetical protein